MAYQRVMIDTLFPPLRFARPMNYLARGPSIRFYGDGVGSEVIARSKYPAGFEGVMVGHPNAPYHREISKEAGKLADGSPSAEHLLVIYLADQQNSVLLL